MCAEFWIVIGLLAVVMGLFLYSLCRAAANGDRR